MRQRVRRVVIFGGTRRTGRLIVDAALRDGYEVTVAARRPEAVAADVRLPPSANIVRADVTSGLSLGSALRGQDAIVLAVSTNARCAGNLCSDPARNISDAAEGTPDLRTVVISSGDVNRDDPALPFWYRGFVVPLVNLRDRPATGNCRISDGITPAKVGTSQG